MNPASFLQQWSVERAKESALNLPLAQRVRINNVREQQQYGALPGIQRQVREFPFPPGNHVAGGNDPLVVPSANNPVVKTVIISHENKPYDSHPGALVFEKRMGVKNFKAPVLRKSVSAMNYYLRKGEGREAYGLQRNAERFLRDWALTGFQWTAPALPNTSQSYDMVQPSENLHFGGTVRTKQIWTTRPDHKKRARPAEDGQEEDDDGEGMAVEGQFLWLLLRRVKEDNPYQRYFTQDDNLQRLSGLWEDSPEKQHYWRIDPFYSWSDARPCDYLFNNFDFDSETNYTGKCWPVGRLIERDTRQGLNENNSIIYNATRCLYPDNDKGTYIENFNKLGTLLVKRVY